MFSSAYPRGSAVRLHQSNSVYFWENLSSGWHRRSSSLDWANANECP